MLQRRRGQFRKSLRYLSHRRFQERKQAARIEWFYRIALYLIIPKRGNFYVNTGTVLQVGM